MQDVTVSGYAAMFSRQHRERIFVTFCEEALLKDALLLKENHALSWANYFFLALTHIEKKGKT